MTVKECYEAMGGNYDEVFGRLRTDERIVKFLNRVLEDATFNLLVSSVESGNAEEAFRAAHTLKGLCMNLSLDKLFASANVLTEALRGKTEIEDGVGALLENVKQDYARTVECIRSLN